VQIGSAKFFISLEMKTNITLSMDIKTQKRKDGMVPHYLSLSHHRKDELPISTGFAVPPEVLEQ